MNRRFRDLVYSIPGVIVGAVVAHGCSAEVTPPEPTYADPFYCDFRCPERGVADGNASISGTPSVDGFFASIIRFQTAADTISAGIRTELDAIGASVGARAGDDLDLKDKLDAFLSAKVTGLKVHYQPVRCTLSARAMLAAEAKCDTTFDPAMAIATWMLGPKRIAEGAAPCRASEPLRTSCARVHARATVSFRPPRRALARATVPATATAPSRTPLAPAQAAVMASARDVARRMQEPRAPGDAPASAPTRHRTEPVARRPRCAVMQKRTRRWIAAGTAAGT
jgi:hypothetical protein